MSHTQQPAHDPFRQLPPAFSTLLEPLLPSVADDIVEAICVSIPEYARPADRAYTRVLRNAVDQALRMFLSRASTTKTSGATLASTYETIGVWEAGEGRSLDSFHLAMRLGSRIAWQQVVERTDERVLPRHQLAALAEALLVHMDDISAAVTRGHLRASSRHKHELALRRKRLVNLLVSDPPASAEAISDQAHVCNWRMPRQLAVAVADDVVPLENTLPSLPPDILVAPLKAGTCFIVPDPEAPGRKDLLRRALRGRNAAVGPSVPVTEASHSLRWASDGLLLIRGGIIPTADLLFCVDHLATLLLFRDTKLLEALSRHHLHPLRTLGDQRRNQLAETLLIWLQGGRSVAVVAKRLQVHHQTVRYRLRQLEGLYGSKLHDPDLQFELELVLRARELRQAAARDRQLGDFSGISEP
ncbi:PucR family transcriptional regulator [Streptomyces sp. NPDC054887]